MRKQKKIIKIDLDAAATKQSQQQEIDLYCSCRSLRVL